MFPSNSSAPQLPEFHSLLAQTDVPVQSETFPDGRVVLVSGDSESMARSLSQGSEGEAALSVSCSLLGCAQILRQFTNDFDARELLAYAERERPSLLSPEGWPQGTAAPEELAQTLTDFDVPAHVEQAQSSEDLAHHLESGNGVLAAVNLGELWNSATAFGNGDANAVAVMVAVARAPETGDIAGWYLNDVAARQVRTLVETSHMERAWLAAGGWLIVTEIVRRRGE